MGKKGQSDKSKTSVRAKNKHNLSTRELQLRENVDQLLKLSTSAGSQQMNINKVLESQKEVFEVIDKIKNLEIRKSHSKHTDHVRNSCDKLASFSDWLKREGAIFEGCSIADFPGYDLGLKADIDIPFGSLFIAVPKKVMMTIETAKESILKNLIEKDQILKNMPNVTLAIYLLVEKFRENSFFKPYIDILPRSYCTVLYFSLAELEELRGSPTLDLALKQIKSISRQYAYFHTIFSNGDDAVSKLLRPYFTFEEYW
ncbi:hypothetical protein HHI36_010996 [Cryptolaemus montrouzieri]|uniref:protein-histidine N-methyltransferase n=1 Tax=Cryptolaemus montrouzieri TaxID=559131 RepID=A0ABD2MKK3_9CUCU